MPDFTLEVEGLKELEQSLKQLEARVAVNILRAAIRKAAKPMIATAIRLAPYDTYDPDGPDGYHLRDHIKLQAEPKRTRRSFADFRLGPQRVRSGEQYPGYPIEGGLSTNKNAPNYALIAEKKTPYLRPAFDRHYRQFTQDFATELDKGIKRKFKKLGL